MLHLFRTMVLCAIIRLLLLGARLPMSLRLWLYGGKILIWRLVFIRDKLLRYPGISNLGTRFYIVRTFLAFTQFNHLAVAFSLLDSWSGFLRCWSIRWITLLKVQIYHLLFASSWTFLGRGLYNLPGRGHIVWGILQKVLLTSILAYLWPGELLLMLLLSFL